ncbi:carbohydrate ABC transporter substrate-binding protein (CUT1 family) [Paenibacillus taihuensis]|uniref:Carbohydrate ABC transporter substrate-binding protein (CUT1 family) n=1 Tax=Paenibacillus taihuensis TaxID=1156355 RepID=A0A3D9SIR1_9BACL|nr:ABC transporter substrate-binding protein [Paenibacillus taihuensis]REE92753.1 carbohydrate ABC transporter substrate-binding protein (CUT1 family) [Paenibacillus taihuensis]
MFKKGKAALALASTMALSSILYGCGSSSSDNGGSASKDEKVELNFIRWSNGPALDNEEKDKVKRFNDSHPNIQVKMTLLPWDETFKKIEMSLASNSPVDLFYWDVPAYAWYKKGLMKNLQPYFDRDLKMSDYDEKLFEPFKFDGSNMYVAPENYQTLVLYYNKDLFDKAGVAYPSENWNWNDYLEAAKKLTITKDGKTTQFGTTMSLGAWWGWMALSQEQGGALAPNIHDPEKLTFNTPETKNALQYLQDLIYKYHVAPDAAQSSALGGDFLTGKIAMYVGGDWDLGNLKDKKDLKWDLAPMPKWDDKRVVPYWVGGYAMTEKSKHPDQAWEFIKWTMTDNQETLAKQQSWIPVNKSALAKVETPAWAPAGYQTARFDWMKYGNIGDLYHLKWREAQDKAISPITDQIFANKISVDDALKKMDEQVNEIISKK